jgi:hypothetical protein
MRGFYAAAYAVARMSTPVATVFNQSYRPQAAPRAPAPLKRVVIVGGGSAGWMATLMIGDALLPRGSQVPVLESPAVGTPAKKRCRSTSGSNYPKSRRTGRCELFA